MAKLAIIGTGFVGTSLGLAVRPAKLFEHVAGYDVERSCSQVARDRGAIDSIGANVRAAVKDAAVVVVAVPDRELPGVFRELADGLLPGSIISDTSTWKLPAVKSAAATLPVGVHFISGRPVLDSHGHGPDEGRGSVFAGAIYCLTPGIDAAEDAIDSLSAMVSAIGAQPYFLSAEEHDGLTGATELLPRLVSAALLMGLTRQTAWPEAGRLAAEPFNGWVRLLEDQVGPPFWQDVRENHGALDSWIDAAVSQLLDLRRQLDDTGEATLKEAWKATQEALDQWRKTKRQLREGTMPPLSEMRPHLLGSQAALRRLRKPR
ncbi:MAG: prephenate dehydrogenase [Chloroflexota bacterium]|nr:prephenate dehydrogenase [Chloroflexota bacterium]